MSLTPRIYSEISACNPEPVFLIHMTSHCVGSNRNIIPTVFLAMGATDAMAPKLGLCGTEAPQAGHRLRMILRFEPSVSQNLLLQRVRARRKMVWRCDKSPTQPWHGLRVEVLPRCNHRSRMIFAGMPAAITRAGSGLVTTEPAPTMLPAPTSASTIAPLPIQAPAPIVTRFRSPP